MCSIVFETPTVDLHFLLCENGVKNLSAKF